MKRRIFGLYTLFLEARGVKGMSERTVLSKRNNIRSMDNPPTILLIFPRFYCSGNI